MNVINYKNNPANIIIHNCFILKHFTSSLEVEN